jgi:uncharacterized membrane protein YdbT with pleckstrin-like domain
MDIQAVQPEKLGAKTFVIFLFKRLPLLIVFLIILAAVIFAKAYLPENYSQYGILAVTIFTVIFFFIAAIILLMAWLEFARYKIYLTQDSIKINRGIISEEQIGVPFRRIQDATIKRGIFYQLLGASALVLNVIGEEGGQSLAEETKIILPALDKNLAIKLQDQILKEAEVEEMSMRTETPPAA